LHETRRIPKSEGDSGSLLPGYCPGAPCGGDGRGNGDEAL